VNDLDRHFAQSIDDAHVDASIKNYETAFRMQSVPALGATHHLIDRAVEFCSISGDTLLEIV
jgi:hypothetical protein